MSAKHFVFVTLDGDVLYTTLNFDNEDCISAADFDRLSQLVFGTTYFSPEGVYEFDDFAGVHNWPSVWPSRDAVNDDRYFPFFTAAHGWVVACFDTDLPARQPPATLKVPVKLNEGIDRATAALVQSSVPKYRNSDKCPKPLCDKTMHFKQMTLVCPVHGFTDTRGR